jgi:hypothetical protein
METLVLAVFLAVAIPIDGRADTQDANAYKQASSSVSTPSPCPINQDATKGHQDDAHGKTYKYFRELIVPANVPNLILCVVGIAGVISAVCTLKWIARQTHYMKKQTGILIQYNRATRDAADAAIKNADAANRNIDLFISKERARVRVEVDTWTPTSGSPVSYKVNLYGPTAAFIIKTCAIAYIGGQNEPPALSPSIPIPSGVILPSSPTIDGFAFIFPSFKLNPSQIADVREGRLFIHFTGFIRYRDIFSPDERTTKFKYTWRERIFAFGRRDGSVRGNWEKSDKPHDNEET